MPEHIRALVYITALALVVFTLTKRPASAMFDQQSFVRRRNLWFAITFTAFLSHNFWLFSALASMILVFFKKQERNITALYFSLLFAIPVAYAVIPGFGLLNHFIDLSFQRILTLILFVPIFFKLNGRPGTPRFGSLQSDKWLVSYSLLIVILSLRETTITDALRQGFYVFIDIIVPYFAISRLILSVDDFRESMLWFVIAIMVTSLIGIFEAAHHWLVYAPLINVLDLGRGLLGYLPRDGILRAAASGGQPIALGYMVMVAIGFYIFVSPSIPNKLLRRLGLLLLIGGLIAPLSRGPWVGAVVLFTVFLLTGPHAIQRLATMALVGVFSIPVLAAVPGGEKIINLIPFVGKTEARNVEYRDQLITNATIVIKRNLLFGSVDYLDAPEIQALNPGKRIDIVNTYIGIALENGVVGLGLFLGFFVSIVFGIYRTLRTLPTEDKDKRLLGRTLLATQIGILLTIMTVSSIAFIPIIYWAVGGIGVAYIQMNKNQRQRKDIP